jgi:hypothetical protein
VAWSTEHVARQTLERAAEIGLAMHVLPEWYDVDDVDSLRMLRSEIVERRSFSPRLRPNPAVNSAELFAALLRRTDLARRLDGAPDSSIKRAAG